MELELEETTGEGESKRRSGSMNIALFLALSLVWMICLLFVISFGDLYPLLNGNKLGWGDCVLSSLWTNPRKIGEILLHRRFLCLLCLCEENWGEEELEFERQRMTTTSASNAVLVLDLGFPVELQTVTASDSASKQTADDQVKIDHVHIRMVQEGSDLYQIGLWSETDVFFNLTSRITRTGFDTLRREQQLVVGFEGFPQTLKKLLVSCINERVTHAALLLLEGDLATLHIVCKMEHKIVELLSFPLQKLTEQELREVVQKRFLELQSRVDVAEAKLSEYASMFRSGKTPSLLKSSTHQNGASQTGRHW